MRRQTDHRGRRRPRPRLDGRRLRRTRPFTAPARNAGSTDHGTDTLAFGVATVVCVLGLAGCGGGVTDATVREPVAGMPEIALVVDVSQGLELPDPAAGSTGVAAGLFMTVSSSPVGPIAPAVAARRARRVLEDANAILAQCELHLVMESVQVVAVPRHLRSVRGNERGSWGGHPPDSVGDPDLFTYYANERLTSETQELFSYGKRHTSRNAIAVFVVDSIEYFIDEQRTAAGGLSFPPVAYHHIDDYPLRNSVLAIPIGRDPGGLPFVSGLVVAHELGHMLLNTGAHAVESGNLMTSTGALLTAGQCARMRANRERLFGDQAVHDPGVPGGG